jgi:hypothetical protein
MNRSAAIVTAYMLALTQGGPMRGGQPHYVPREYTAPRHSSNDAERIAKAEAKRARKAAKRAKKRESGRADA